MCWAMASGLQNQEGSAKNRLRKQLAAAVQSLQWSYAIYWTISTREERVLEWGDGYYNGDIKTRKTVQPMELSSEQMGLQRSLQLRELYESLSLSDSNQQARRSSAALSPEDLTDTEWFYLVCMSFVFNPGQGLPGRALANGHHIWLCNAHHADSKVFTRSLLAKSASIQTVLCFPVINGVLELGVTELVTSPIRSSHFIFIKFMTPHVQIFVPESPNTLLFNLIIDKVFEDLSLVQCIAASFTEAPKPICSEQSMSSPREADNDEDQTCSELKCDRIIAMALGNSSATHKHLLKNQQAFAFPLNSEEEIEIEEERTEELRVDVCDGFKMGSPNESSDECGPDPQTDDSFTERFNNTGQVQSWQFIEEVISNGLLGSVNSSDCISQSFVKPEKVIFSPTGGKLNPSVQGDREFYDVKLGCWDQGSVDSHYMRTLSAIFHNLPHSKPSQGSLQLFLGPCHCNFSHESSFSKWRKGIDVLIQQTGTSQRMLKKILFDAALLHRNCSLKTLDDIGGKHRSWKLEGDDVCTSHVLLERRRREKLNEKFVILRSLVPSESKVDKASILGDTIDYLKELERKVEELEACKELGEFEARAQRKHPDIVERTSDNYACNEIANGRKPCMNKRKAVDEPEVELNWVLSKDSLADVTVTIIDKEVVIEIRCLWREYLLLKIVEAISNLHLDAHSVQSSTVDNVLVLMLRSKFRTAEVVSAGKIKEALQRIIFEVLPTHTVNICAQ